MSLAFSVAGVLQTSLERVLGEPYIVSQEPIRLWMLIVFVHGLMVPAGAVATVRHLLTLKPAPALANEVRPAVRRANPVQRAALERPIRSRPGGAERVASA